MRTHPSTWATILGLLAILPLDGRAEPLSYTFTLIADDLNPPPFFGVQQATINAGGTVAFTGFRPESIGRLGIFTGSGGPLSVVFISSPGSGIGDLPVINAGGTVAYHRVGPGINAISTFRDGVTTILYNSVGLGPGPGFTGFSGPSLNNQGVAAFAANFRLESFGSVMAGVFTGSGGPTTPIADTSGPFSGFVPAGASLTRGFPAINNADTVAFFATLAAGGSGIFLGSSGPVATIADTSGPFASFGTAPAINDAGAVAFFATLDAGSSGLFLASGGTITTVADTSGPFNDFMPLAPAGETGVPFVSLNSAGTVAFFATLDAGGSGIFTGPDPVLDRVIGTGDLLFGSTVTGLLWYREALNDAGQVAFAATLADGRLVFVRANPIPEPVPEPGSVVLLGVGALGVLAYSRGRRVLTSVAGLYRLYGPRWN